MEMQEVERWGMFEIALEGPAEGNPFQDVELSAEFQYRNDRIAVDGFYDGAGIYRIRFMPDREGAWRFITKSSAKELDGRSGDFVCTKASFENHGPVRVRKGYLFEYGDGTPFLPFGTTCYHWTHTGDEEHERLTIEELRKSPFNKVRMCLLPTRDMRPGAVAYEGTCPEDADTTRFNPAFFAHLEKCIHELMQIGVEADLILFHPYDKQGGWGFNGLSNEQDFFYLRYVIARLGAFRNVWWSLSNEYDFNRMKTVEDWDRLLLYVQRRDAYQHLRSIHNGTKMYEHATVYDFTKSWLTHQSIQHWDAGATTELLAKAHKPVVIDEISYEGNVAKRWGNITGLELMDRYWEGMTRGGFVAHGECFENKPTGAWISRGGRLYGESPERIRFLRRLIEEGPEDWMGAREEGSYALIYLGKYRFSSYKLSMPSDRQYQIELIDIWNMSVSKVTGTYTGQSEVTLPAQPYMALRLQAV
ncbi:hypothetical protein FHS19_000824 [Paenibacillus rhizosphaerae]|uniref:DUF5060 domain-containing protein n=1 Tax=Paenibacillus rhizosphaerae TaxID=297318 RepID=A0A839TK96_9BACL|nr:DUF5060 domain-containing protein [Paenibacillus rhizosphaerae]MBB3126170.1 hypothetical protein [Paenibacillus rhizosphaerae]